METSLHRELKQIYGGDSGQCEIRLGKYRIDAVCGDELVEIQHGSLAAIRRKIAVLLETHRVRVVKPLIASKRLVKHARQGGRVVSSRLSPKRATAVDLFDELIYFHDVFPHDRLTLEVVLVTVEEHRFPGHGRRRRWRKTDQQVADQKLVAIESSHSLQSGEDLLGLLGCPELPCRFDTAELAAAAGIDRSLAQRIAYCLRHMGIAEQIGKQGRSWRYELSAAAGRWAA